MHEDFQHRLVVVADAAQAKIFRFRANRLPLEPVEVPGAGMIPPHDGSGPLHFALAIPDGTQDAWRRHLGDLGVLVESEVAWSKGRGHSLYFRDPDGHCGEMATRGLWERT